jgi:hypothetical protein
MSAIDAVVARRVERGLTTDEFAEVASVNAATIRAACKRRVPGLPAECVGIGTGHGREWPVDFVRRVAPLVRMGIEFPRAVRLAPLLVEQSDGGFRYEERSGNNVLRVIVIEGCVGP